MVLKFPNCWVLFRRFWMGTHDYGWKTLKTFHSFYLHDTRRVYIAGIIVEVKFNVDFSLSYYWIMAVRLKIVFIVFRYLQFAKQARVTSGRGRVEPTMTLIDNYATIIKFSFATTFRAISKTINLDLKIRFYRVLTRYKRALQVKVCMCELKINFCIFKIITDLRLHSKPVL